MKVTLYKLLILLCIICTSTASFSQNRTISDEILFKTGVKSLPNNVDAFIENPNIGINEVTDGYIYRLVQFHDMPNLTEQKQFFASGIQLIEYIPNKAYLVAIPVSYNFSLLKSFNVRAITKMAKEDKMNEYLRNEVYPDWSVEGEEIKLYVKLNGNISKSDVLSAFLAKGAKVLDYYYRNNLVFIKTTKSATAIDRIVNIPFVNYVETIDPPSAREDTDGNSLNRSHSLKNNGLNYDGTGISVQVRDDGPVGPHIDFQGRIQMVDANSTGSHGDGVAGIFGGAGNLDPSQDGGASGAFIYVTDYVANFQDTTYGLHLYDNMNVTNSSYSNGCNAGYTATTQTVDNQIYASPTLMHVFSAGNSNSNDCGYGAGTQWGNITGGHKIGKNVIATANLTDVGALAPSSSRGPASDGRLKPDLAAHGNGQGSTDENNTYQAFSGTSAAAPSVAGVIAQLMHAYKDINGGQEPESALIKAAAMNTAGDLGNVGPDYKFGWGLIDGRRAYNLLQENRYLTGTVSQGNNNTHTIAIPTNVVEARIMVYWMDPQGSLSANKALVNDLDMTVTGTTGTITQPLILNPAPNVTTLNAVAVPGIDDLNNVEQVRLTNPTAGNYTVNVAGTVVPTGSRDYYVLYEFITDDIIITYPNGGEGINPSQSDPVRVHWDAYGSAGNFMIELSTDNGVNWSTIGIATANARSFSWNPSATISDQALIRVTRGGNSDVSDAPFTIIDVPSGVSVDTVCVNGVTVSWNAVPNATSYDVMFLGNKYMDSVVNTTSLSATIPSNPYISYWVSVRARYNSGIGTRANAVFHSAGIKNCVVSDDLEIAIISPSGAGSACSSDSLVVVQITNLGTNDATGGSISYQFNGATTVTQSITNTILSGQSIIDTFNTLAPLTPGVTYDLKTWVSFGADLVSVNDTATSQFDLFSILTLPYSEDFESYASCGIANDCGNTVCSIGNGWINIDNGNGDDIDWRIDDNGTASGNTGPSVDFAPGTTSGNYLYLEASGGCNGQVAELISPCIDLSGITSPLLEIGYHMFGGNMGSLHFDVYSNGTWTNDIIPSISGNQGDVWNTANINLTSFIGSVVNIRVRGVTGNGFESDIAIDGFNIFDFSTPPNVAFSQSATSICPSIPVSFYDESTYLVTNWKWVFSPNTVTFLNNTTDTSQNPIVSFNAQGQYDVKLIATNINGSDSLVQTSYIDVNGGVLLPYSESFESFGNCGTASDCELEVCSLGNGWTNEENGTQDDIDWRVNNNATPSGGTGPSVDHTFGNASGKYLYLEASGGCSNRTAELISPCIDLSSTTNPYFSLWYHMLGGDMGALHIDILSNGTWINDIATPISGDQGNQWIKLEVPLTTYIGQSISLRVRAITGSNYESDIAIDDFNIFDITTPPVAAMDVSNLCANGTIFEDNSTNGATNVSWDFGVNATPATAVGAGPHNVTFSSSNDQTVKLIASSIVGTDTLTQLITNIQDIPVSDFSWTTANETISLTNNSVGATSYFWSFGNGNSSTLANPNYTYPASGLYNVVLTATNDCGSTSISKTIQIIVTDIENVSKTWNIDIFPNPNSGQFNLKLEGMNGDIEVSITDIQGKLIRNWNYTNLSDGSITLIDASELASGIYIVKVKTDEGIKNVKLFIE
ncbi:MAG: S8 family serine peptidase [Saprospiraceae bacterium]